MKTDIIECNSSVRLAFPSAISGSWKTHLRCKFCPDTSSFGILTSQQGSKFQNSEIPTSEKNFGTKAIAVLDFNIFPPVINDMQIWVFLTHFWDDGITK